jgi:hypothetical protein
MTGTVADLAATGQTRTQEEEAEHRLDCLAKYWIGRPRQNAKAWLDKQRCGFADDMRQRMNKQVQIRKENRS